MKGRRLDAMWNIDVTTVAAALARDPSIRLQRSRPNLFGRVMGWVMLQTQIRGSGLMPWYFHTTMTKRDQRRPRMEQGLGVVVGGRAVFYPRAEIERGGIQSGTVDVWDGRELKLRIREEDRIPTAEWADGERPFQLFSRWYGFSFTYPNCEVFSAPEGDQA